MARRVVSMCWYSRLDYRQAREMMVDKERFPPSFDEWKLDAERMESIIKTKFGIRRVFLRPSEFLEWCETRGMQPDAIARDRFANEFAGGNDARAVVPYVVARAGKLSLAT